MVTAKDHYENHLSELYGWMSGDFTERVNQTLSYFIKNNIKPSSTHFAIDLGSGHGIQSAALAELGFNVTAVDQSEKLLNELKQNTANKVKTVNGDITDYGYPGEIKPELIICMGDTLTHLNSSSDVNRLIRIAAENLAEYGKLVLSFRDLTGELKGISRFIPVKSDEHRILTCLLEYEDKKVTVNDILHEYRTGKWEMKISSYQKLRLSLNEVTEMLLSAGLKLNHTEKIGGMDHLTAQKN